MISKIVYLTQVIRANQIKHSDYKIVLINLEVDISGKHCNAVAAEGQVRRDESSREIYGHEVSFAMAEFYFGTIWHALSQIE